MVHEGAPKVMGTPFIQSKPNTNTTATRPRSKFRVSSRGINKILALCSTSASARRSQYPNRAKRPRPDVESALAKNAKFASIAFYQKQRRVRVVVVVMTCSSLYLSYLASDEPHRKRPDRVMPGNSNLEKIHTYSADLIGDTGPAVEHERECAPVLDSVRAEDQPVHMDTGRAGDDSQGPSPENMDCRSNDSLSSCGNMTPSSGWTARSWNQEQLDGLCFYQDPGPYPNPELRTLSHLNGNFTNTLEPLLVDLDDELNRLSVHDRAEPNALSAECGDFEMAYIDGDTLPVPDVESPDDSDMDDATCWEWNQEKMKFQHWDEEDKVWVQYPDAFH